MENPCLLIFSNEVMEIYGGSQKIRYLCKFLHGVVYIQGVCNNTSVIF